MRTLYVGTLGVAGILLLLVGGVRLLLQVVPRGEPSPL